MTASSPEDSGYALVVVTSTDDWATYHDIRRRVLFEPRQHRYDDKHPDETTAGHFPLLFKHDGRGIGTTRLDLMDDGRAALRLVAIESNLQGKGHGRALFDAVEAFARSKGARQLVLNAAPKAIGYYEHMGFQRESWDPDEVVGIADECVQMVKTIG